MLELTGLNGAKIYVQAPSIIRIRPPYSDEIPAVTVVDYNGGYLRTLEPTANLLKRLPNPPKMIPITTPDGAMRFLNAAAISQVRPCAPENGTGTEMYVGGRYQHAMETVEELIQLIG